MLVLSRKPGESVVIDGPCRVTVLNTGCRLGIEGEAKILRGELVERDRQARAGKKTIHLVDDSLDMLRANEQFLTHAGFEVQSFTRGRDYLDQVKSQRTACAAVVDLRLGPDDIDGLEILRKLRSWNQDFPVIMLTGYGDVDSCRQAFHSGCYTFLQKPVQPKHLAATLETASNAYLKRLQSLSSATR